MRNPLKKKTFILLELLIGFALVSMSILPFLRYPYLMMKKEINLLFEMELERKLESELCALYDYAVNLHIDPHDLFHEKQATTPLREATWTLTLAPQVSRDYDIHWKVIRKKYKLDDQHAYALAELKAEIFLQGKRKNAVISASIPFIAQTKR